MRKRDFLRTGGLFLLILFGVYALYLAFRFFTFSPEEIVVTNVTANSASVAWWDNQPYAAYAIAQEDEGRVGKTMHSGTVHEDDRTVSDRELENGEASTLRKVREFIFSPGKRRYSHHITITNLNPDTSYQVGVGSNSVPWVAQFIDDLTFTTDSVAESVAAPEPAYGSVFIFNDRSEDYDTETDGYTVINIEYADGTEMISAPIAGNGSWYMDLTTARYLPDGTLRPADAAIIDAEIYAIGRNGNKTDPREFYPTASTPFDNLVIPLETDSEVLSAYINSAYALECTNGQPPADYGVWPMRADGQGRYNPCGSDPSPSTPPTPPPQETPPPSNTGGGSGDTGGFSCSSPGQTACGNPQSFCCGADQKCSADGSKCEPLNGGTAPPPPTNPTPPAGGTAGGTYGDDCNPWGTPISCGAGGTCHTGPDPDDGGYMCECGGYPSVWNKPCDTSITTLPTDCNGVTCGGDGTYCDPWEGGAGDDGAYKCICPGNDVPSTRDQGATCSAASGGVSDTPPTDGGREVSSQVCCLVTGSGDAVFRESCGGSETPVSDSICEDQLVDIGEGEGVIGSAPVYCCAPRDGGTVVNMTGEGCSYTTHTPVQKPTNTSSCSAVSNPNQTVAVEEKEDDPELNPCCCHDQAGYCEDAGTRLCNSSPFSIRKETELSCYEIEASGAELIAAGLQPIPTPTPQPPIPDDDTYPGVHGCNSSCPSSANSDFAGTCVDYDEDAWDELPALDKTAREAFCNNNRSTHFCVKDSIGREFHPYKKMSRCEYRRAGLNLDIVNKTYAQTESVLFDSTSNTYIFEVEGNYTFTANGQQYTVRVTDLSGSQEKAIFLDNNSNGVYDVDSDEIMSTDPIEINLVKENDLHSIELRPGMNLISIPIISDENLTAQSLMELINNELSGTDVVSFIGKFDGKWTLVGSNVNDYGAQDFPIAPGQGYAIKVSQPVTFTIQGQAVQFESSSDNAPISLTSGWNLIGLYGSGSRDYTAEEIIDDVNSYTDVDFTTDNVTRWSADKQRYEGLQKENDESGAPAVYGFDFPLDQKTGYFMRVINGSGTWEPKLK